MFYIDPKCPHCGTLLEALMAGRPVVIDGVTLCIRNGELVVDDPEKDDNVSRKGTYVV